MGTAGVTAAAVGTPWAGVAAAATDDELAYANFGISAEFLASDFYARAIASRTAASLVPAFRRGRAAAVARATALGDLLVGAGEALPVGEDFAFVWPNRAFTNAVATRTTGLAVLRPLLGAYQTASATVVSPSYRVLYASLAAGVGQQIGALAPARAEPLPAAVDLESASAALESYLG